VKSMEQSPSWEADTSSDSQEFPHILRNMKVHYRLQNCPPPVPILRQINPVHAPTSHFWNNPFNIIPPSTPWPSEWYRPLKFPYQEPLLYTYHMPRPSHFSWLDHPKKILWAVHIIKLLITSFFSTPLLLLHYATNRQVAGSIPDGVIGIFQWHNPSGRTMALGST